VRDVAAAKRSNGQHNDEMTGLQKPLFFRLKMLLVKIVRERRMAERRVSARNEIGSGDVSQSPTLPSASHAQAASQAKAMKQIDLGKKSQNHHCRIRDAIAPCAEQISGAEVVATASKAQCERLYRSSGINKWRRFRQRGICRLRLALASGISASTELWPSG
jgi:hypothetical protein